MRYLNCLELSGSQTSRGCGAGGDCEALTAGEFISPLLVIEVLLLLGMFFLKLLVNAMLLLLVKVML